MFNSKLKKENRALREALELAQKEAVSCRNELLIRMGSFSPHLFFSVKYTLTDSDFVNYKQETARAKVARQRMAMSLGNKIAKVIEPEEVIEDGVLIGYKYSLQVRRAPVYEENPKLVPSYRNVYEGIWKEGQRND